MQCNKDAEIVVVGTESCGNTQGNSCFCWNVPARERKGAECRIKGELASSQRRKQCCVRASESAWMSRGQTRVLPELLGEEPGKVRAR